MHEFKGLEDGGKTVIKCEFCGRDMITIWNVKPSDKEIKTIVVYCCGCNSKSKEYKIMSEEIRVSIGNDGYSSFYRDYEIESYDGNITAIQMLN